MKCLLTAGHPKPNYHPYVERKDSKIESGRLIAVMTFITAVCQQWPFHNFSLLLTLAQGYQSQCTFRIPCCEYNFNLSVNHKMKDVVDGRRPC